MAVCGVGRVRVVIGGEKKMIQRGMGRTYHELAFAKLYINSLFYSTIAIFRLVQLYYPHARDSKIVLLESAA